MYILGPLFVHVIIPDDDILSETKLVWIYNPLFHTPAPPTQGISYIIGESRITSML